MILDKNNCLNKSKYKLNLLQPFNQNVFTDTSIGSKYSEIVFVVLLPINIVLSQRCKKLGKLTF